MDNYQEIPCERDDENVFVPPIVTVSPNMLIVSLNQEMVVQCGGCGSLCLKFFESSYCQDCVEWPPVVYEDILDAEEVG
jgi:hypothetical protein